MKEKKEKKIRRFRIVNLKTIFVLEDDERYFTCCSQKYHCFKQVAYGNQKIVIQKEKDTESFHQK